MRIPGRGLLSVAVTVLVLALGASAGLAQGSAKGQVYRAYLHAKAADQARQARMDARAHTRSSARPAGRSSTSRASATAKDVEQIAEDSLKGHGGEKDTQVEPDMAMDPNNEDNLVAVMQQGRYRSGASVDPGFSASLDGGQTWTDGNLPGLTVAVGGPFRRASDPTVIFGPDHTVYASTIALSFTHCLSAVSVQSSNDGGLHWNDPEFPENDATCDIFNDKNWLGVDTNPASPFFGRLYLVWSQFTPTASPAVLRYSDDEGQTWSDLIYASSQSTESEGLLPLIQSNGDLTIVYDQTIGAQDFEVSQTSHDGGLTFDPPVTVGEFLGAGDPGMRTGGLPAATIDPTNDAMYAVWQDTRFRTDGHNDIVISESSTGGSSWTAPARVNGPNPQGQILDHFTPDVAAYSGTVHVTYRTRDLAGKQPSNLVDQRYIVSTDGGATFGGELVLGPPADLKYAAVAYPHRAFLGDYSGVVANGDVAHAVWCVSLYQHKARFHQTTWSATITP
ncbi:MAG TPA: sialidase family protein [Actinomycetota bacterium]